MSDSKTNKIRPSVKVSDETALRLSEIALRERKLTGKAPTFGAIISSALDAYECISSTVQGSPSTGVLPVDDRKSSKRRAILQKIADLVEDAIHAESGYQPERPGDTARVVADIEEVSQRLDEFEAQEKAATRADTQRRKGGKRGGGA